MIKSRIIVSKRLQKLGIVLVGVSILFLLAQLCLKWGVDYYLRESAKIPIRIGHLFVNPATSRVTLSFQGEKPGQDLQLDLGAVRFDWWTVFLKRLRLGNVSLQGLQLDVEKTADSRMIVGGIPLASAPPPSEQSSSPITPSPAPARHPWGVGVGQIEIQNVKLHYRDPELDLVVVIHRFHLDPAESWHANRPTPFDADLDINGGHLLLTGFAYPFHSDPSLESHVQLRALPLAWLTPILKASKVSSLKGNLGVDSTVKATYQNSNQTLSSKVDGTLTLQGLQVSGPAVGLSRVDFDGALVVDGLQVTTSSGPAVVQAKTFEIRNGQLKLLDATLTPPFRWTAQALTLKVSNIDTANASAVVPYALSAHVGRYEKINLQGHWAPFGTVPDGTVDFKIDGLNLTAFTPYTQKYIGYRLGTGLFDLKSQAEVKQGLLESTHGLVAHKLHFEKLSVDEMDESSKQIGLPLNLCLGLLRDADDNIRLDVPLEGDLRDPKVPVGKLLWTLIGKALVAALRAAATAFFPSGGKMGFDPIVFAPGQAVLSSESQAYLAKVGEKMALRPEVGLKLSGLSAPADWYAIKKKTPPTLAAALDLATLSSDQKEKLLTLAAQRAEAMRSYLAETAHIDPKRLPDAAPQIDPQATSVPRAELSL